MSYDDAYFLNEDEATRYNAQNEDQDWYCFLQSVHPRDFDTSEIERTVQDNAAWLQARPRNITEILSTLFPGSIRKQKDLPVMAAFIGGYLFDSGYTPHYADPNYPTWYWQDGAALPRLPAREEAHLITDPLSADEFQRQWDQIQGG